MTAQSTTKIRYTPNKPVYRRRSDTLVNCSVPSHRFYSDRHQYKASKLMTGYISVFLFTRELASFQCHTSAMNFEILRHQIWIWTRRLLFFHAVTHFTCKPYTWFLQTQNPGKGTEPGRFGHCISVFCLPNHQSSIFTLPNPNQVYHRLW